MNWTFGTWDSKLPAYDLSKGCASQNVVVDVDGKTLLVIAASKDNTKQPFTAMVRFSDSDDTAQYKVTLRLQK